MKLAKGNMWTAYREADLFCITTNSFVKKDGSAVMGAGIAKQAKERLPGIDLAIGQRILQECGQTRGGVYGLLVSDHWPKARLAAFQVKTNWNDKASLALIRRSTEALIAWCDIHPKAKVQLNFPGIGNGKLKRDDVLPIIEALPDNVTVWEYGW